MAKYVKTDYVPEGSVWVKAGKKYKVKKDDGYGGWIASDHKPSGDIYINYLQCCFLDDRPWTIINR